MKKLVIALLCAQAMSASAAEALRLAVAAEFTDEAADVAIEGPHGEILLEKNGQADIFLPPYALAISSTSSKAGKYKFTIALTGLGPEFRKFKRELELAPGENILIPSLPVRGDVVVKYNVELVDDTSTIEGIAWNPADTVNWGSSVSIHYSTHWMRNSYADYAWNRKMAYLEDIYDRFRHSFLLSKSERIEMIFFPEPTDAVYLDQRKHYAIHPGLNRIDMVFGQGTDSASPAPGEELLVYRLWGYGPRWMATGLPRYYDENHLWLSSFVDRLDESYLAANLAGEDWVTSDTGSIFCGGFVNWLLTEYSLSNFRNLYKASTELDFRDKFHDIYQLDFESALLKYLAFLRNYEPGVGELIYYASLYQGQWNYKRAEELYAKLTAVSENREYALDKLALCRYWNGEFVSALDTYDSLLHVSQDTSKYLLLKADVLMAMGEFERGYELYQRALLDHQNSLSGLRMVEILNDGGQYDSARIVLGRLGANVKNSPDYSIDEALLKIVHGEPGADSILNQVAAAALNMTLTSQDEPRGYFAAGRAFGLQGKFDKAMANLKTAFFLERRPAFQGMYLLELGKISDLNGDRNGALDYYRRGAAGGAGKYIEMLCRKYIDSPYKLTE